MADPADPRLGSPEGDTESSDQAWWDDPRLPWRGKPTRNDILCWAGFSFTGIYALVLLPLRPILLGANPYLLAALGGSRISAVTIGALAAIGIGSWPLGLLLGTFGIIKFHPLYWWAGKLWGRGLIEIVAGRSPRASRGAARAERLAVRFGPLAIFLTYLIPLPSAVVYASLGATGMSLRRFLLLDAGSALITRGFFVFLGYQLGQPAVDVVEVISRYSWYLSLALTIGILINLAWHSHRRRAAAKQAPPTSGTQPSPPDLRSG